MDYDSLDMNHKIIKMLSELSKADSALSDYIQFVSDENKNTRRTVEKLEQQLNDLRKELADLKKTED